MDINRYEFGFYCYNRFSLKRFDNISLVRSFIKLMFRSVRSVMFIFKFYAL